MATDILYGSPASLFTGKVRGYLNWKGVRFDEVQVTPDIMKSVIMRHVGWPVIPVLRTPDGRIIQDTADIISEIETRFPNPPVTPTTLMQQLVSFLVQLFADEWLTLPAMHYRWNYNEEWIYSEFGRSSAPDASPEEQVRLGKERGQKFKAMVPALGIDANTIPGIEASYEAFLADFSTHLQRHPYVLGARPSLGDFALLGPLYAHLYRDPASGSIMKRLAPLVSDWTERMIGGAAGQGELLDDDRIPSTLEPILARHLQEHLPVLQSTNERLAEWAKTVPPGTETPRGFGATPFEVGGRTGMTAARSFSLFRLQDVLDTLAQMDPVDRARAGKFLDGIGGSALMTFKLAGRLERRNYRLTLAGDG